MECTPVSRATLQPDAADQIANLSENAELDAVGLVFLFFTSAEWQS